MRQPTTETNDTVSRAEFLAMQAEYDRKLAALTGALAPQPSSHRRGRSAWRRLLLLLPLVVLIALVPVSIRAANPFNDLTGSVHDPNIDLIYNAGITTGCVPNVSYCPKDTVTREQMASFIARTAGLGTNPPVARAARLGVSAPTATSPSYAANELIRAAQATSTFTRDTSEMVVTKVYNIDTAGDTLVAVIITAPSAGFVVVNATVGISIEPSSTGGSALGTVGFARLRDASTAAIGIRSPLLSTATGSGSQATTLGPTYIFPVEAGARAFVLELQKAGQGSVRAFDGTITALFVPFDASGATIPQP